MIVIRDTNLLPKEKLVATIGFFDGVHRGHRFLIDELKAAGRRLRLPTAVITFAEHPRAVLQSDYQPKLLNSFEEKVAHLATTGVDYCIVLDFTPGLARLTAREFITSVLCRQLHVDTLLIGYDHRFGRDRADGFEQYVAYGAASGMKVWQASPYAEGRIAVSSSEIRKQLARGQVEEAARGLTYPYVLKGHIVSGYKVGRTLGFPTANIQVDEPFKVIPGVGVYAVWVNLRGKRYKGMLYIGKRPTLQNGDHVSLEVNILDFSGDIYAEEITVSFIRFVREDCRFDSLEALRAQLACDRNRVNALLDEETGDPDESAPAPQKEGEAR